MEYKFEQERTPIKWVVKNIKFPFSNVRSVLTVRKEKKCTFCVKKIKDCLEVGLAITNKGNKLCCEDCSKKITDNLV